MRYLKNFRKTVAKTRKNRYNVMKETKELMMDVSPYRSSFFGTIENLSMRM